MGEITTDFIVMAGQTKSTSITAKLDKSLDAVDELMGAPSESMESSWKLIISFNALRQFYS